MKPGNNKGEHGTMKRQDMNRQWRFQSSRLPCGMVDLPHDFSILQKRDPKTPGGRGTGFFPGGEAEYSKTLAVPPEWKGKKVILEFEGVYMNATVRLNDQIVAQHPYGYTSFHCNLTPFLKYGKENVITVQVNNNALPNSRWYSGSGIYRPVWIMVGESLHVKPWGVYVTAPEVSVHSSKILVKTEVENSGTESAAVRVRSTLLDACGAAVASGETELQVAGNSEGTAEQNISISPVCLWSTEDPYLYTLKSEIIKDSAVIDTAETPVGIRSISFDSQNGFRLNGVSMKLKGGNVHHDCGILGAASYARAEERKAELLKANGFNAVRCAHNPPSSSFLDACDRLGMLVLDEAFDCWRESKNPYDYHLYFNDWWKRDMASMVLRDRNHPSVILWSTGNEIPERDGRSEGYDYAKKLADYVRSLDNTRAVTNAICWPAPSLGFSPLNIDMDALSKDFDLWGETTEKFAEPLDVVGYNYLLERYGKDAEKYPNRVICGTESFLGDSFKYWETADQYPNVIGDFYWTSMDYLGEAGIGGTNYEEDSCSPGEYPWHQAFCGDIDICGFKRPQSYYRDCVWGISKAPYIAVYKPENHGKTAKASYWGWQDVVSSWTWPGFEGKPTVVEVYSEDDKVELFLNGKTLGRKPAGKENGYTATYELNYEPGTLLAVGYRSGSEASRSVLKTAGKPAAIRLTPDRDSLKEQFGDLSYVTVELEDTQGNIVGNADNEIHFSVCGVGSLLAVGSGNPVSEEMYVGNVRKAYQGRAMVVIRADGKAGDIVLTAVSDGIPASSVTIRVH